MTETSIKSIPSQCKFVERNGHLGRFIFVYECVKYGKTRKFSISTGNRNLADQLVSMEYEEWKKPTVDGSGCLVAGTMIAMADGSSKEIQTIEVGDIVLGSLIPGLEVEPIKVTETRSHDVNMYVSLRFSNGEVMEVSQDQPIFTPFGPITAGFLNTDVSILTASGEKVTKSEDVRLVDALLYPGDRKVYSLEFSGAFMFFAGSVQIAATCGGRIPPGRKL